VTSLCGLALWLAATGAGVGCNSLRNGWLDPTALGEFERAETNEIRTSLSLEDIPTGIPGATYPQPQDFELLVEDFPIIGGDTLDIEINELRQRLMPYRAQIQVSPTGYVNLPVVGRVRAAGFTPMEFQDELGRALRERTVLVDPEVTVNPLFLGAATYSIFGIGVSASNDAPLRAGTFPIRRPDLRLLEAINQVGGLNEFITEVYVFRRGDTLGVPLPAEGSETQENSGGTQPMPDMPESGTPQPEGTVPDAEVPPPAQQPERSPGQAASPEQDLFDIVTQDEPAIRSQPEPAKAPDADVVVPPELEPEVVDPYIYVDGQFIPNPAYVKPHQADRGPPPPPAMQTITPAVNWARLAGDTTYRIIVVPADLLRAGDMSVNMFIRAGDVIRVVSGEIGVYYVMGQVNRVGPFRFESEAVTLKAAIAAAGGLSGLAWPSRCTIYRRVGPHEQMIQVDLDRVFAGADPDFFIKRGDIVNVGTHPFAPFLQRIRALTLPNPINNIGYSFTYSRNFADIDSFAVQQNPANKPPPEPLFFP
jgi:protein involved in polysaccharide export with SLBB domain